VPVAMRSASGAASISPDIRMKTGAVRASVRHADPQCRRPKLAPR
jgi:hypothetical protein